MASRSEIKAINGLAWAAGVGLAIATDYPPDHPLAVKGRRLHDIALSGVGRQYPRLTISEQVELDNRLKRFKATFSEDYDSGFLIDLVLAILDEPARLSHNESRKKLFADVTELLVELSNDIEANVDAMCDIAAEKAKVWECLG